MGTAVTWINYDQGSHTVTSDDGLFASSNIPPGGRFTYTFESPGIYRYHCQIHPSMRGTVSVVSPQAEAPAGAVIPSGTARVIDYLGFYTPVTGTLPVSLFTAPQRFNITGLEPSQIYYGGLEDVAVPYSQYLAFSTQSDPYSLWIEGVGSWIRYAQIPRNSSLSLVAITPQGGSGTLYEIYPDGRTSESTYQFYEYNRIAFYADRVGRQMLFYTIGRRASNVVVIDVTSAYDGGMMS